MKKIVHKLDTIITEPKGCRSCGHKGPWYTWPRHVRIRCGKKVNLVRSYASTWKSKEVTCKDCLDKKGKS